LCQRMSDSKATESQFGSKQQTKTSMFLGGPGPRIREAIPHAVRGNTTSDVLCCLIVEAPTRLKVHTLQGGEEDKALRIWCPLVHDMPATFGRHVGRV
jgi:hypothetical protein